MNLPCSGIRAWSSKPAAPPLFGILNYRRIHDANVTLKPADKPADSVKSAGMSHVSTPLRLLLLHSARLMLQRYLCLL